MRTKIRSITLLALFALAASTTWARIVTLQTDSETGEYFIEMPTSDIDTLVVPNGVKSFKVYDDGGKDGTYGMNVDGYLVVVAPDAVPMTVTGTVAVEGEEYDYLSIYDGYVDNSSLLLDKKISPANDVPADIGIVTSSGNVLTLYFYADDIYSFSGLDLNVGLAFPQPVSVAPVSGGSISTVSQATVGSTVKLKATAADGYVLDEIVAYSDGTPIRVQYEKWCDSASFVMPDGPVTITPSFVPASDLSVNMPVSGAVHVGLPAGVVLKVYDDGGSSGNYSNKASGYMRLTAPQGYVIRVAGSLTAEGTGTDNLTIFDGDSLAQKLLNAFAVNVNGATGDIGAVYSTDNVLTLFFKSDNTVNFAGLDLTVTAEDPSVPHNVVINSAVGGSITVNGGSTSFGVGTVVTLAATPEANMVLTGVSVLDGAGNPVPVTGGKWYSGNVASFVMPASDVSVTPEFANTSTADDGLYINMPITGTQQIFIPDNVESFYLYDDGGKDGNYSNNVDGILEMVAPEKTRLFFEILSTKIDSRDRLSFNLGNGKWSGDYLSGLSHLNKLGVKFHSDASANYAGFEILVEQSLADSVTMNQADGGTVACDKRFPGTDSVVTLTITPDAGYLLKGLSVVDGSGNPVIVNGLNSFSSSLTFTMPASSVTVTPEFTDDLTAAGGLVAHMPKTGVQTVEIPSGVQTFKLYDDGGKDGTYSSNAQGYLELVAPQGHVLQIAGTIVTQSSVDILTVYDGSYSSLASNPVMVAKSGSNDIDVLVSSENAVTLYFHSNASNEMAGLDLLVNLVDLSAEHVISVAGGITGGTLGTSLDRATSGTTVSLNATPDANCVFTGVTVTDDLGHKVAVNGGTWYAPVATFDMPGTDVTVTPTFEANVPLDNDFYINMPATGSLTVSIPAGMPAFKFYDDGGKNGRYTRGANGIVEMVAPEGYSILVTENKLPAIYGSDYLYIYEGENLLARVGNSTRGIWESSGNTMKFVFASVGSGDHTGFDFTVTLVNPNVSHEVVLAEAQGGTLSIENNIAACGSPVTVTAHPDDNYVLSNVVVADSIGRAVPVTEGAWYSDGTASFTMPCLAAIVTPEFTNDLTAGGGLSVNMPKIGRRTIHIPEGVTSFKVYDDGGENGNYSDGADGWLELIAPDGYVLQVTGTRGTSAFDYPAIYDGLDTSVVLYDGRTVGDVAGSIGTYASSGNAMIIYFSSNAAVSSSATYQHYLTGIDFTVDVVKLADKRSVTVSDGVTGGAVNLTSTEYSFGTTVMLSTVPADGYMLAQIVATDEKGNSLKIEGDCVFENSCWFVMPNSNVTVTPTFVDDPTAENGLYTNMPKSGTRTISIPASVKSFKVYDDGGRDAPYSSNADGYLELIAPSGYIMQVAGSVYMAEIGSHVQIYDGATVDFDKRLVLLEQSKSIDGYVESSGEVLKLYLHTGEESPANFNYGADLTVTLVNKDLLRAITVADGITNGSVSVDMPNAKYGTPITVTTTPAEGYFLKELSITANGEPIKFDGGTWFGSNAATFNMPSSDVSISAEFASSATADDGLYINMLENATRYATIPSGVSSFKVYDNGGKDGSYSIGSSGADDYLQLTAPAGYVMQVTGTVKTYNAMQYLTIYDGESSSTTKLLDNKYGRSDTDIGTLTSTGGVITLYFHAGNYSDDGLDLTVTMVPTNETRHVTVSSAENGTLLANNDDVEIGTVVTLTASPADGFVLSENMTIQGCNGDEISFSGGWYTNNQVSFVMPGCDVTVTPVFDSERFVKMPLKGVKYVQLPEGVTSLKIYDDGGKDGYYGVSADGYIVVTAPDGSVFSTSGSVRINNRGDYITIVDGDLSASMTSADRRSGSFNLVNQISSSNVLTFHLVSDKTICDAGLDLALTVFDVGNTHEVTIADGVVGGTVSVSQTPAALGEVVELTATPAEDYFLVGVSAVDGEGNSLTITDGLWFTGNKATFTMPYSDVTFTPTFVTGMTEDEARYINLPTAGKKIINIPAGTPAFHVYDDGGKDGDYSLNADGYIVFKAPEGYVIQLTGSEFDWDSYNGFLQLFDADSTDSGKEFFQMSTSTSAMSTKRSAGNVLTLRFSTRNSGRAGGFDIIVSLVDANEKLPVTVTDGGSFNMLERGWIAATVPEGVSSFHVYDDGGASENYGGHDSSYVELIAPQGHVFVVSGNIDTDGYNLTLFDGDTSSNELYTKAQGDVVEGLISASNVMTLYFRSSCTPVVCQAGFDLDITVMDVSVPHTVTTLTGENGSVELSGASERYFRDTVTYVANAEEGYYFVGLDVMAGDNQISVILDNAIDQNRSVAKFVMPNTDVSVTPIFMAVANQYSGFYVTTPVTGNKIVAIPAGITSFKVYDDGGKDADCSKGATGILELTAPEGYVFKMTGSLTIQKRSVCSGEDYCRNFLKIRNGTVENLGYDLVYSQSTYQQMDDPTVYDLGTLTSTGNTITVELHTNEEIYNNQNNNLDMSVELEFVGIVYHVSFDMESLQTNSTYYAIGHGDIWKNSNTTMDIILSDKAYDLLHLYEFVPDAIPYFNRYAWSPTPDVSSPPLVSYALTDNVVNAANINASSPRNFMVYAAPDPSPETVAAAELMVHPYNGTTRMTDAADFHGQVVLSQTWGVKTFSQTSETKTSDDDGTNYLSLMVPSPTTYSDTLVYNVNFAPEPGYVMSIPSDPEPFTTTWMHDGEMLAAPPTGEGWGYDASAKTLKILPRFMPDMVLKVNYALAHYDLKFDQPLPESGVFVTNNESGSAIDWFETSSNKTFETVATPTVYDANGCRVAWKVKDRSVTSRSDAGIAEELPYMVPLEDDANALNEFELDLQHPVCDNPGSGTGPVHVQTLQIEEGQGKIMLVQNIGADPSQQVTIEHEFVSGQMNVPVHLNGSSEEVGVPLTVVVVPEPGYVLKQLTYDMTVDGSPVTVLVEDGATINVKQDLAWRAKFVDFEPVYVTYDLQLGPDDSSKVWIPTNATLSEEIVIPADGSAYEMWKPSREGYIFDGWTKDPNDNNAATFTYVDSQNSSEFSNNAARPTQLYAKFRQGNIVGGISNVVLRYYDDIDQKIYSDVFGSKDTLVVTQKLGSVVFEHKITYSNYFFQNPHGYKVSFGVLPVYGHELADDEIPQVVMENYDYSLAAIADNGDGTFTLGAGTASSAILYAVGYREKGAYKVALSPNAGDAPVTYGEHWTKSVILQGGASLPVGSVFRKDACFAGWSFEPEMNDLFYYEPEIDALDASMLQERANRLAMGLDADTLYARWNSNSDCRNGIATISLADDFAQNATVSLYQMVDGAEVKVIEVGNIPVGIPFGVSSYQNQGPLTPDGIAFSRIEITPKPGATLDNNYQLTYVKASDPQTSYDVSGNNFVFDENVEFRLQGLVKHSYDVVYHENAGDANVFYGENWNAEVSLTTDDPLSYSLYRADKCVAGWSFEGDQTKYKIADAEFVAAYEARVAAETSTDLYAVWSDNVADCGAIETFTVSLSNDLKGVATVELIQTVGGEPKVVATVGEDGISIPKMQATEVANDNMVFIMGENGYFSGLRVVPATGYELVEGVNPTYKVGNADAVEVTDATPAWLMTDETVLSGAVASTGYTIAFNENAGNTNVFYPADWSETGSYNIVDNNGTAFPKLYRTDKCLVGYGFNKDASRDQSFQKFDTTFVMAYDSVVAAGVASPVLYGVWNECTQALYKITLNDIAEGTLVLSHNGKAYNVPSTGFVVPEATPALEFGLAFTPNLGYKLADEGSFNLVNESGVIQSVIENNTLAVDGDKIVDAPVVTLENTFAFVTNAGDAVLFYGDDWVESALYSLDAQNVDFPKGIYRVDSCFKGWALNTESDRTHLQFNTEFLDDVEATRNAGLPVDRLYAIWGACETEQTIVTVANADSLSGTFTLSRKVSQTAKTYTVAGTALQVPADEALTFAVTFVPNKGYTYDETVGITAVDATDVPVSMNAGELVVATSLTLSAAATADTYTFALNENAGDANVFYTGSLATEFTAKMIDDAATRAFPVNLYRSDACLEGWNFSTTAMVGFSQLDDEFVMPTTISLSQVTTPRQRSTRCGMRTATRLSIRFPLSTSARVRSRLPRAVASLWLILPA